MAKLFGVDVKLQGQADIESYEMRADDEACALGIALDELEDDLGAPPKVEWVAIVADPKLPGRRPTTWDTMPTQIRQAMDRAIEAEGASA